MAENYIYTPECNQEDKSNNIFKCRVPLKDTLQTFVVDGNIEESLEGTPISMTDNGYSFVAKDKAVLDSLFQIINIRNSSEAKEICMTNQFSIGRNSIANVLLCSHTLQSIPFVTEEHIQIKVEQGGILNMVVMQNEHNLSIHKVRYVIDIEQNAKFNLNIVTLHGGEIENDIEVHLNGKGGEALLNGLYLADGTQRINTSVNVNHKVAECFSSQLFKGVLEGESITRFNGVIYVAKDAQKTQAYQANNNLLASKKAKVYTEPHLEIYADDVKCSHGATVGSLNEQELYYMRSRGIALDEAKLLQKQAFAYAVLEKISNEGLRERLHSLVERRLRGEFNCNSNCTTHCC